jgi:hypothetical protein
MAPDVTTWIEPASGDVRVVPTGDVRTIRFTSHGRGALEGLGLGFAVGVGVGASIGAVGGATDDGSFLDFTPAEGALVGGVAWGLAGTFWGGLVGLSRGATWCTGCPPIWGLLSGPPLARPRTCKACLPAEPKGQANA